MNFADYNAFRVKLQWLIEGDELTDTFSVDVLDTIVGLGEERIFHGDAQTAGLRASTMVTPLTVEIADNAAALPADLLELKEVYFSGKAPVEVISLDQMRKLEADGSTGGADTRYCAQDGDTLRFWPGVEDTLVDAPITIGSYYAKPESLETVTWADATTLARYPALYLYTCLYEGTLFLGMPEKAIVYEGRYRQLADGANHSEAMRVYGGSPLRIRSR